MQHPVAAVGTDCRPAIGEMWKQLQEVCICSLQSACGPWGICCMLQNRLWPTLLSDSVGSIMSVPETGHDMVGAWKP